MVSLFDPNMCEYAYACASVNAHMNMRHKERQFVNMNLGHNGLDRAF